MDFNIKIPTLNSHTHYQAAQLSRTIQSLSKGVSESTHGQKRKSTITQHCIKAIAGEVVNSRSVHLINFGGGGQVIVLKSATALILGRWRSLEKTTTEL
jgi:hypothetical protein